MGQAEGKGGPGKRIGKSVIIGGLFAAVLAALVLYASSGLRRHTCEVCIVYEGSKACRKADGKTKEEAVRTATDTACAMLASGMTETLKCTATPRESESCDGTYSGTAGR